MMNGCSAWPKAMAAVCVALIFAVPALAGSVESQWDASSELDVRGYNIYAATSRAGLDSATPTYVNGRQTTSHTHNGLADCTTWYLGIKAIDNANLESLAFSDLVIGYPNPEPASVVPNDGGSTTYLQGESRQIAISGINFDGSDGLAPGDKVRFTHQQSGSTSGVTATQIVGASCGQLVVTIQIAGGAPTGAYQLTVFNEDASENNTPGRNVFGDLANALTVTSNPGGGDTTPPTVLGVNPPSGATDVALQSNAAVTFSEPIDPTSVNPANVRLVDSQGIPVTQAGGSPQTSGAVVTIFPAVPLQPLTTYRVEVVAGGARDLAGNAIASTFSQNPGFTTQDDTGSNDPPSDPPQTDGTDVTGSWPVGGDFGIDETLTEVLVDFNRDMAPLFSVLDRVQLTRRFRVMTGQTSLTHRPESPRVSSDGLTVIMSFEEALVPGDSYSTFVDLSGAELEQALAARGMGYYVMPSPWSTRPHWRVAGAVDEVGYRDSLTETPLAPRGTQFDDTNTNVPVDAEFFVRFAHPVVSSTLNDAVFSISVQVGRRYQTVDLLPISTEDGGRTVILRPAQALPASSAGLISIRTGPNGVQIDDNGTERALHGGSPIQAPFATEVSGSSLTLGVGE